MNIALDLLFVGVFHWGVWSAALATSISQFVSLGLCIFRLCHYDTVYRVCLRKIRFHLPMLKQVIHFGLPSGVQNSIIAFANVIVQSNINAFGSNAMAGCGTYAKLEGFAFLPITCFTMALTTFVSQNLGAHQYERVKKGVRFGIVCSTTLAECIGVVLFLLAEPLVAIFQNDPAVIEIGVRQAHVEALFFCPLHRGHYARRWQADGADVHHACHLVCAARGLYLHRRAACGQNRRHLHGLSAHLGRELYHFPHLLP